MSFAFAVRALIDYIFVAISSFSTLLSFCTLHTGYNGLPSIMSGLDDSLSDIAGKKKYPFELEKAIHNVMFIQHHMQRQDEFNAVSSQLCRQLSIRFHLFVLLSFFFMAIFTNYHSTSDVCVQTLLLSAWVLPLIRCCFSQQVERKVAFRARSFQFCVCGLII